MCFVGLILSLGVCPVLGQEAEKNVQDEVMSEEVKHPDWKRVQEIFVEIVKSGNFEASPEFTVRFCQRVVDKLGANHPLAISLTGNYGFQLYKEGHYQESRQLFELELKGLKALNGLEEPKTLKALNNYAQLIKSMEGLREAFQIEKEVLARRLRILGAEHPETLMSEANLAESYRALGDFDEAKARQEKVLEAQMRLLGLEHPDTLGSQANLAATLFEFGDFVGARDRYEKVLGLLDRILGAEHPDTLTAKANLAVTLNALGDFEGAKEREEEVLETRVRLWGAEHPATLTAKANLAVTLNDLGDLIGAKAWTEEVLDVRTRVLGAEHPATLSVKANLAALDRALGHLESAKIHGEEVLEIRSRLLGSEHPDTLTSKMILARTLDALGDFAGAKAKEEEVLDVRLRLLGLEHPDTLTTMGNLAGTLRSLGDLAGARAFEEEVLEIRSRIFGLEHPDTQTAKANLAITLRALGDLARARALGEEVLGFMVRVFGSEHPDTLIAKGNLAGTLRSLGDLEGAKAQGEEVLTGLVHTLGSDHPLALTMKNNLAETLRELGDLADAQKLQQEIFNARKALYGDLHPGTQTAAFNLATTLQELGDLERAKRILRKFLDLRRSSGNLESITEAEVANSWRLARLYRDTGALAESMELFDFALQAVEAQAGIFDFDEESQSGYHSGNQGVFYESLSLAYTQGYWGKAFDILERFRTFSRVAEQIRNGPLGQTQDPELAQKLLLLGDEYNELTERRSGLDVETDWEVFQRVTREQIQVRRERDVLLGRLARERRADSKYPKPTTVEIVQDGLDVDTALLAFSFGVKAEYGFVVTREQFQAYKIDAEWRDLFDQMLHVYLQIQMNTSTAELGGLKSRSAWLMKKLVGPAMKILKTKPRWLILPDHLLHRLPFGALAFDGQDGEWSWLPENHAIHVVQSATVYNELVKKRPDGRRQAGQDGHPRLLALGDPDYGKSKNPAPERSDRADALETARSVLNGGQRLGAPGSMQRLPYTKRELDGIASLFQEKSQLAETHLKLDANEDRLHQDLRGIDYIHIASHGISLPNDPENGLHPSDSFLALTLLPEDERKKRGLKQNGLLQAWEIANHLQLDAELVVLSACETAIGENRGGEGLMSLARAFLQAGARSVLASLWKVDDLSTSELMIRFYRHLLDGESKVDALRFAQMELASGPIEVEIDGEMVEKDFTAPYYWAGFQLIGDWK